MNKEKTNTSSLYDGDRGGDTTLYDGDRGGDTNRKTLNTTSEEIIEKAYSNYYHPLYPYQLGNKTEQAFRVVCKLVEKGLISPSSVKEFVDLVEEIAKII